MSVDVRLSRFTKDVRVDTLTIGLLNALAWYFAYPLFIVFVGIAGVFGDLMDTPVAIVALPMLLFFLGLSLVPAAFSSIVTYSVAFVIRNAYHYRLHDASWRSVVNLGVAYSTISIAVFAIGMTFRPPYVADQERQIHELLWPTGVIFLNVLVSFVSAAITYRQLRPGKNA